ncbi:MAG TPA: BON domain-containing protein [Candidatus Saccharimonadales bacterium]|nr:BON domain-containing protein [Candidatus Saccharimonadales bacterium]
MTDPQPRRAADAESVVALEELQMLQGEELPEDQDAVLEPDEFEGRRVPTRTELDHGASDIPGIDDADALAGLATEGLRDGETDDPQAATEEGLTYVPPSDPPVRADAEAGDGIAIAAGPAVDAIDEPYDDDHRSTDLSAEGDLTARIRDALEADAATSTLVDRLIIGTIGGRVVVRGVVDDTDDADTVVAVIERVAGVSEVDDQTELTSG